MVYYLCALRAFLIPMDSTNNTFTEYSIPAAEELVQNHFGLKATCEHLVGYSEQNFKVTTEQGDRYILKISLDETDLQEYDFQHKLFVHLKSKRQASPTVVLSTSGLAYATIADNPSKQFARLLTWQEGKVLGRINRRPPSICRSIGTITAQNTTALQDFEHPFARRFFSWNSDDALWAQTHINHFEGKRKHWINEVLLRYEEMLPKIKKLKKSVIHNDINENNILYDLDHFNPIATSLIDYGDAIYTSRINNLAIALAYLFQYEEDILKITEHVLSGYQEVLDIDSEEFDCLFDLICIRLVISLVHAAQAKIENPDNTYTQSSVEGCWKALERLLDCGQRKFYLFTQLSTGRIVPTFEQFHKQLPQLQVNIKDLLAEDHRSSIHAIDLGLDSDFVPHKEDPYYEETFRINMNRVQQKYPDSFLVGGYGEIRDFYTTNAYKVNGLEGDVYRTKHLGIDIWLPEGTVLYTPWTSTVKMVSRSNDHKDYGTLVVLEHSISDVVFYSLYGHLSMSTFEELTVGQGFEAGEPFAKLGTYEENGHWNPHVHVQLILDLMECTDNFDGVARPDQWNIMSQICPDPGLIFRDLHVSSSSSLVDDLMKKRQKVLGYGLSVSYDDPLHMVKGDGVYLIDEHGQKFLDTVNNVAHVGHENFAVVQAAQAQMATLNTNTRYLHPLVLDYAERLKATFPESLSVLHFTNSGSEANELALRMAKTYTQRENILAIEFAYHGNSQATIDISSYKFNAKGGAGQPEHTFLLDLPDALRRKYGGREDSATMYIEDALSYIRNLINQGHTIAAFIHEGILSCGGQIVLPKGYLKAIYQAIREQGGVVIADEVQVGFGRVGKHFWSFELQDVVPDIVVMGKPIGNGHPLGAVICTESIAHAFNNGMEYFNTFGGNPVSAAVGRAVLKEIQERGLQQNALEVGLYLKKGLLALQQKFVSIADIRGEGLFLGIEFLDEDQHPDAKITSFIANAMRKRSILMSTDGPDHNVLKIKPPIVFTKDHADHLLSNLEDLLLIIS